MTRSTTQILNDPVLTHSRKDFSTLRPEWTVGEALDHMRATPPGGRVIYFYVTEETGKLLGVVPTRRLLLSAPTTRMADLMIRNIIAIPESATVLDACEFFTMHRLLAFPVVDSARVLIGVIDVDVYTDELAADPDDDAPQRTNDDIFELIGVHLTPKEAANPLAGFRRRFPWLACNIAGGLLAAGLAGIFQDALTWKDAVLALFIPVVLGLAESVAMQSVTLTVGRIHTNSSGSGSWYRQALSESATGVLLGLGASLTVAAVATIWLNDLEVTAVLFLALLLGVTISAVVGFAVPTLLHRLKWSPQVAAGPVSLAVADILTLLGYFGIAKAFAG